jgi:hypothetical protein
MVRARLMPVSIMVFLLAGCASEGVNAPPPGLPHAAATRSCGPTDGPAVAIYLSAAPVLSLEPSTPYVRVAVWQPLERLTGKSWLLSDGDSDGAAWSYATAEAFEVATRGEVTVTAVSADSSVEGVVDVTFPSAGRVRGGFKARWLSRTLLCG